MSEYSASVAYGEPVFVDENDELVNYPSAAASYLNPTNESVSVVDSYFFDIIDDLAQDPDFIQDFGPVALPIAQTNARPVPGTQRRPPVSAMSYPVADGFVAEAGIITDATSYVSSPSFSDSFYFNIIDDQDQIQQYNQFLLDEEKVKESMMQSKQSFYAPPVTYAIPASSFEKSLAEEKESDASSFLCDERNYGWNEKASAEEFAPMKAPRLSKKMNRAIKQKNNVKAVKLEKTLKMPIIVGKKLSVSEDVSVASESGSGVQSAKSKAASMRQRVEGKFKKLQTKWIAASDFFVKTNNSSPVSPYSLGGLGNGSGLNSKAEASFYAMNVATATAGIPPVALPKGTVVNHVWNKWNQPPLDYGLPSGMQQQQHYGGSSSGSSSSSSSSSGGCAVGGGIVHSWNQYGTINGGGTVTGGSGYNKSRFGKLDLSAGGENS